MFRPFIVVALSLLVACGPRDLAIADTLTVGSGGGLPDAAAGLGACRGNGDCLANAFCEKDTCEASTGTCAERPLDCDDGSESPVCGCDSVNYWNDCVRKQAGVSATLAGDECDAPAGCDAGSDCPVAEASCAQIYPSCPAPGRIGGVCWMLPDTCPGESKQSVVTCDAPIVCDGICNAIRSGVIHVLASGSTPACSPGAGSP
jgi:hypothetical protein